MRGGIEHGRRFHQDDDRDMEDTSVPTLMSAMGYYASSIPTLLRGLDFWRVPMLFVRRPVRLTTRRGLSFFVSSIMDVWLLKEVVLDRQYEQRRVVRAGDTVVDIGAGIGDFAVLAGRKARQVFSFEREAKKAALVRANLRLNNCRNVQFSHSEVRSLDEVFKHNNIQRCHFLKVDCEGCEYTIFARASAETLSRIDYIVMEIHLFTPEMKKQYASLKDLLTSNGFRIVETPNPVHKTLRLVCASNNGQ